MKYYVGSFSITEEPSSKDHSFKLLIAANNAQHAEMFVIDFASNWKICRYAGDSSRGTKPLSFEIGKIEIEEISAAAFFGMKGLMRIGNEVSGDLLTQDASEQTKTLARRLAVQFEKMGVKSTKGLPYGKILDALAASLGETDWQVLKHKAAGPVASDETLQWTVASDAGDQLPVPRSNEDKGAIPIGGRFEYTKTFWLTLDTAGRKWYFSVGPVPPHSPWTQIYGTVHPSKMCKEGGDGLCGPFDSPKSLIEHLRKVKIRELFSINWSWKTSYDLADWDTIGAPYLVQDEEGKSSQEFNSLSAATNFAMKARGKAKDREEWGTWMVIDKFSQMHELFCAYRGGEPPTSNGRLEGGWIQA